MNFLIQKNKKAFWQPKNIIFFLLFALLFLSFSTSNRKPLRKKEIFIHNKKISALVADTALSREQGLSILEFLPKNKAMLFIFNHEDVYPFWMKGMNFPIDIVWLDTNKKVVFIKKNARPEDYPMLYTPDKKSRYVLEFNSGFLDENNINLEDLFFWDK